MNKPLKKKHASPTKLSLLRRIPVLARCSNKELAEVARHVDEISVTPGTVLTREGTPGREAFVIVDGWAAVTVHDEPVAALGPGELVGEMAMIDGQDRSATVVAKTDMRLLVIGPAAFSAFAAQPPVAKAITRTLTRRLRDADGQLGASSEEPVS